MASARLRARLRRMVAGSTVPSSRKCRSRWGAWTVDRSASAVHGRATPTARARARRRPAGTACPFQTSSRRQHGFVAVGAGCSRHRMEQVGPFRSQPVVADLPGRRVNAPVVTSKDTWLFAQKCSTWTGSVAVKQLAVRAFTGKSGVDGRDDVAGLVRPEGERGALPAAAK